MNDRSWMINPKAVRAAKQCIQIVRDELGVKLLLSNPDFLHLLTEYAELTDSEALQASLAELMVFAGVGNTAAKLNATDNTVVNIRQESAIPMETSPAPPTLKELIDNNETIECGGKMYQRWRDGKEFSGLYRGQPTYR
ncbi:hypothetical protein [Halioxenophilus aromaticivorans]|uniref:Uncharacterized protein n=1 Tax=Halioxenophilus aromaticivorans TaxID=1306992 RepID=A0AAV3TXQ6_9ALTE